MGRSIAVLAYDHDRIKNVSHDVARVMGWRYDSDRGAVYVQGCGMDMAFHLVYSLARTLYSELENDDTRDSGYWLSSRVI